MKKSLLLGIAFAQNCLITNRLCIEDTNITQSKPFELYYPTTLIPTDITTLMVAFYKPNGTVQDPCSLAEAIITQPIVPRRIDHWINVTTVTVDVPTGEYILQLSDPDKRQCLLGPNIRGLYFESVQVVAKPAITSSIRPTITITVPDAQVPNQASTNDDNRIMIIALAVTISAIVLVLIILVIIKKRKVREVEPGVVVPTEQTEEPPRLSLGKGRFSMGKFSFGRTSTDRRNDTEGEPRASMAIERPSTEIKV